MWGGWVWRDMELEFYRPIEVGHFKMAFSGVISTQAFSPLRLLEIKGRSMAAFLGKKR